MPESKNFSNDLLAKNFTFDKFTIYPRSNHPKSFTVIISERRQKSSWRPYPLTIINSSPVLWLAFIWPGQFLSRFNFAHSAVVVEVGRSVAAIRKKLVSTCLKNSYRRIHREFIRGLTRGTRIKGTRLVPSRGLKPVSAPVNNSLVKTQVERCFRFIIAARFLRFYCHARNEIRIRLSQLTFGVCCNSRYCWKRLEVSFWMEVEWR